MNPRDSDGRGVFFLLLGLPLAFHLLFFIVPMAVVWAYSFGVNEGIAGIRITGTLANYARALEPLYLGILGRSLLFTCAATAICLFAGFPLALAIAFAPPVKRDILLLGIMLPFWTNLLIRTYALMTLLRDQGPVNGFLGWFGVGPFAMMNSDFAVMLGLVQVHLPFMILPIYAALDRMDRSLVEASFDLGAGHISTIRHVILPLALPGIASGVLLTFVPMLGAYLQPDLLGGPDSLMIANVIERQFKRGNDWPFGAALAFLLMYLTFLGVMAARWRRR